MLELTWEYAPAISGGLGVACAAICEGMRATQPSLRLVIALPVAGGVQRWRPGAVPELLLAEGAYAAPLDAVAVYAQAVEREFGGEPFDVLHAHDWLSFEAALRLHRICGAPIVAHVHSLAVEREQSPHPYIHALEGECLRQAAAVIAVGRGTARRVVQCHGVDPSRVHVVHNGVDLPSVRSVDDTPDWKRRPQRITFVGRLMSQKGPDRFVEMGIRLLRDRADLSLSVVGDGEMRPALEAAVQAAGLAERIVFHGFQQRPQVDALMRESRAVLIPSRHEPFGLVALEAIVQGTPVIVAQDAGVADVIASLVRVAADDPDALVAACSGLLNDPELAESLRRAAWAQARELTWTRAVNETAAILRQACGRADQDAAPLLVSEARCAS